MGLEVRAFQKSLSIIQGQVWFRKWRGFNKSCKSFPGFENQMQCKLFWLNKHQPKRKSNCWRLALTCFDSQSHHLLHLFNIRMRNTWSLQRFVTVSFYIWHASSWHSLRWYKATDQLWICICLQIPTGSMSFHLHSPKNCADQCLLLSNHIGITLKGSTSRLYPILRVGEQIDQNISLQREMVQECVKRQGAQDRERKRGEGEN